MVGSKSTGMRATIQAKLSCLLLLIIQFENECCQGWTTFSFSTTKHTLLKTHFHHHDEEIVPKDMTRRKLLKTTVATTLGSLFIFNNGAFADNPVISSTTNNSSSYFDAINLTQVAVENKINVTLMSDEKSEKFCQVDDANFTKVTYEKRNNIWQTLLFKTKKENIIVKQQELPKEQLLVASMLAGSFTEVLRTVVLHPLSTIKTRIQATVKTPIMEETTIASKLQEWFQDQKNLYAGLVPSLLITVPCSGLYFAIRDVILRDENYYFKIFLDPTSSKLIAAFLADIVTLSIQTPANILTTRQQVATTSLTTITTTTTNTTSTSVTDYNNLDEDSLIVADEGTSKYYNLSAHHHETTNLEEDAQSKVPNNSSSTVVSEESLLRNVVFSQLLRDSWIRLPAMIYTDLPYLLSRIALTSWLVSSTTSTSGNINLIQYEIASIIIACLCAAATTPWDVAQTRIVLLANNKDKQTETTTYSVRNIMKDIMKEDDGGISNLYAGWVERTIYLGIGRAWLDPIRIIGYLALRDAILLKWF